MGGDRIYLEGNTLWIDYIHRPRHFDFERICLVEYARRVRKLKKSTRVSASQQNARIKGKQVVKKTVDKRQFSGESDSSYGHDSDESDSPFIVTNLSKSVFGRRKSRRPELLDDFASDDDSDTDSARDADDDESNRSDGEIAVAPSAPVVTNKLQHFDFDPRHPQFLTHECYFIKSPESTVVNLVGRPIPRMDDATNRERYCILMFILFLPFRDIATDFLAYATDFSDFYDLFRGGEYKFGGVHFESVEKMIANIELMASFKDEALREAADRAKAAINKTPGVGADGVIEARRLLRRASVTSNFSADGDDSQERCGLTEVDFLAQTLAYTSVPDLEAPDTDSQKARYCADAITAAVRTRNFQTYKADLADMGGDGSESEDPLESRLRPWQSRTLADQGNHAQLATGKKVWDAHVKKFIATASSVSRGGSAEFFTGPLLADPVAIQPLDHTNIPAIAYLRAWRARVLEEHPLIKVQLDARLHADARPDNLSPIDVAQMLNLNQKQRVAFFNSVSVVTGLKTDSWMSLFGEGGTGKSRVVAALRVFVAAHRLKHTVLVLASTGAAAVAIEGQTTHRGFGLSIAGARPSVTRNNDIRDMLRVLKLVIIDEVSMVSQSHLTDMHDKICKLLTLNSEQGGKLFGGICALFLGDFYQLQPVKAPALWRQPTLAQHKSVSKKRSVAKKKSGVSMEKSACKLQLEIRGRFLWEQVNACVILDEQMRLRVPVGVREEDLSDVDKANLRMQQVQRRVRDGTGTSADRSFLRKYIIGRPGGLRVKMSDWTSPDDIVRYVVRRNPIRVELGRLSAMDHARRLGEQVFVSRALDMHVMSDRKLSREDKEITDPRLREYLLNISDSVVQGLPAHVFLYEGAPLIITENLCPDAKLANGAWASARISALALHPSDRARYDSLLLSERPPVFALEYPPDHMVVAVDKPRHTPFRGLEPDELMIYPLIRPGQISIDKLQGYGIHKRFNCRNYFKFTRLQLPVTSGFAMTDFRSQGATFTGPTIVDIAKPPDGSSDPQSTYVQLTRCTTTENFGLARDFDLSVLQERPHPDLLREMDRFKIMEVDTLRLIDDFPEGFVDFA
jgi:hypothetical protein